MYVCMTTALYWGDEKSVVVKFTELLIESRQVLYRRGIKHQSPCVCQMKVKLTVVCEGTINS